MDYTLSFSTLKDIYVCVSIFLCAFMCVCVSIFIVNKICMPISFLGYNYTTLNLLLRTCLHTSGIDMWYQYQTIRRLVALLTKPLGYLPYYGLTFRPYTLILCDLIYTALVYKRTNSISTAFSTQLG